MSSMNIRLRRGDWITEGKGNNQKIVGQVVKFKVTKNKVGPRMRTGEFDFYNDNNSVGVKPLHNDNLKEVVVLACEYDVITRGGAWYYFKENKFQGLDALVEELHSNADFYAEVEKAVDDILKVTHHVQ